ncbi:hypothetical protein PILCRDRAFT_823452 [Piloderma croceum F 1598]|uniref:Uncharacterized protein n=1 Tax=Piloderma croceum (strain F 1598) TaxID=765440 RepID=A0A0C3F444_PILCF|nr:hypothetical protein PILCRDRAFT_823452 [Piloderma croceum F 1598]
MPCSPTFLINGKERASGYNRGVNLVDFSVYLTDSEINDAAKSAYKEAEKPLDAARAPSRSAHGWPCESTVNSGLVCGITLWDSQR